MGVSQFVLGTQEWDSQTPARKGAAMIRVFVLTRLMVRLDPQHHVLMVFGGGVFGMSAGSGEVMRCEWLHRTDGKACVSTPALPQHVLHSVMG